MMHSERRRILRRVDMLDNITNLVARLARRAELSDTSSEDTDDSAADDEILQDATEEFRKRIAARRCIRPWQPVLQNFECVLGAENEENVLTLKFGRCGINRGLLKDRGGKLHAGGIYKRYYKCAHADACNCQYIARVLFDTRNGTATIEQPTDGNVHNEHVPLNRGPRRRATAEQLEIMNRLIDAGCTPKVIFRHMQEAGIADGLTLRYVQRYKNNRLNRRREAGNQVSTYSEWELYLDSQSIESKSVEKEIGVCNYELRHAPNQVFIVESSMQLLNRLVTPISGDFVCWSVDAVYKVARGHAVILVCAVDWNGAALPCAFAVVPTESTESYKFVAEALSPYFPRLLRNSPQLTRFIVADNHKAIAAGFGHTNEPRCNEPRCNELEHTRFDTTVLACWFHQKQDLERELPKKIVNREHEAEIVADIRALHQIPYPFEHLFDMALRAFHRKWWDDEQAVVQYIDGWDNRKWSLAHRPAGLPTTNNSHERLNRELKQQLGHKSRQLKCAVDELTLFLESGARPNEHVFKTTYPEADAKLQNMVDKYIRNDMLNERDFVKHTFTRTRVDEHITLYATAATIKELKSLRDNMQASDHEREIALREIFRSRIADFMTFYENILIKRERPTHVDNRREAFARLTAPLRSFHVVTPLPNNEKSKTIHFQCTCSFGESKYTYATARRCRHVVAERLLEDGFDNSDYLRIEPARQPGRPPRMAHFLARE
jgi:hypothetical protein